ncbi:MAG: hypothetical protein L7F78_01755, partial [Syntrophales bacterium LBB04]|nr:hypothetical protein [Syntrophales bacterium LBB04]
MSKFKSYPALSASASLALYSGALLVLEFVVSNTSTKTKPLGYTQIAVVCKVTGTDRTKRSSRRPTPALPKAR